MKRISYYASFLVPDEDIDASLAIATAFASNMESSADGVSTVSADITISTTDQYGYPLDDTED